MRVIKESRREGYIHEPINVTFIALIPKFNNPSSYEEFWPISLCNCLYKIIARRIKEILSRKNSKERFGFMERRQIHEAIGVVQEEMHSLKIKKLKGAMIKIDLSKAYEWVNWLYIRML